MSTKAELIATAAYHNHSKLTHAANAMELFAHLIGQYHHNEGPEWLTVAGLAGMAKALSSQIEGAHQYASDLSDQAAIAHIEEGQQ